VTRELTEQTAVCAPARQQRHDTNPRDSMAMTITKKAIDLGLVTTHGDAMLASCRSVLGLEYKASMAMPEGGGTMHRLPCGDRLIKLVVLPQVPAATAPGGPPAGAGYRWWTITVGKLSEMVKACAAAGHPVALSERETRPGVRIAMVADPEGNWVTFLQIG
jgi:hypothetical protein